MKYLVSFIFVTCTFLSLSAKDYKISGQLIDAKTLEPIEMAGVRLMKLDSTYVGGMTTGAQGQFALDVEKSGKYILQLSFIGYNSLFKNVTLTSKVPDVNLGKLALQINDIALKEATIKARAAQLEIKGDTFVYNAAAYRTPDGSTLEALVDKLPGAEVADDGSITINGKTVSQILIDGKDFFKGDNSVAMKNLPVDLIEKLKTYDKQSEYTKQTGIDDGNEQTVLDVNLKRKLKSSWISNIDLGIGTKHRYSDRIFISRFTDTNRISIFGALNNVNDQGFRGGGGGFRGGGGGGLTASKSAGLNGYWNNGLQEDSARFFQVEGNVRISHRDGDNESRSNSETFLSNTTSSSSFANNANHNWNENSNFSARAELRWKPDSMTSFEIEPSFSHSKSNSNGLSRSATFNANPYDVQNIYSPLDSMFCNSNPFNINTYLKEIAVNRNAKQSLSESENTQWGGELNLTRRLNKKGRNISFGASGNSSTSKGKNFNISDIYYYQKNNNRYNNQYEDNPSKSWNLSGRLSYSEPIVKDWFFQGSYDYQHSYSDRDRTLFQLDSLKDWGIGNAHEIGMLPMDGDSLNMVKNWENSQYATYINNTQNINLGIRYATKEINFHAGIRMQPQHTRLDYQKHNLDTIVTRNVFNIAPDVRLRIRFSDVTRLDFRYRGSSSQPSMTDLLDVTDTSDPLHITKGNPGLKPSWSNDVNTFFNTYIEKHQQSVFAMLRFSQTSNSISNAVVYDEQTGVRTSQPENINGNWSTNAMAGYNRSFGKDNQINLNTHYNVGYSHSVGYMSVNNSNSQKNTMKTLNLGSRLRASYRYDLFEFGVSGSINYSNSRSELQRQSNMENYRFSYGGNLQYTTPWNTGISTDISMNSRRGYDDNSMNTNELIWNAQLSQTLFNKTTTLSIQFYDLLHRQSNISRNINAQMRQDSWNNSIYSYVMVHLIYRLNIFAGKSTKSESNGDRGRGNGYQRGGQGMQPGGMRGGMGGPGNMRGGGGRM